MSVSAAGIGAAAAVASAGASIAGAAGGGGGAAKASKADTRYNNYLRGLQQTNLNGAQAAAYNPANWAAYSGQRVADFTPDQTAAFDMIRRAAGDTRYTDAAGGQVLGTLGGQYLGHTVPVNPYMGNSPSTYNPYTGARTEAVINPMLGLDNPYLNRAIQTAQGDVSRNYNRTIAPQTDASFARAGAFGGSAWGEQTTENNRQLAQELGRVDSTMRMQDYTAQQGLQESNAARLTGVNAADLTRNSGLAGNQITNNLGVWNTNAGLAGTTIAQNENAYQAERNRQLQAVALALGLHNQRYTDANHLLAAGNQQQAQGQNQINALMDYYKENQQANLAPYTYINGLIQQPSAQTPVGQSTNPWAAGIGGAIMGAQAGAGLYDYGQKHWGWGSTPTTGTSQYASTPYQSSLFGNTNLGNAMNIASAFP